MDQGFWAGTGVVGALVTVAVFQASVRFSGEAAAGAGQELRAGEMISAQTGEAPSPPRRIEEGTRGLEQTLASLRAEADRAQARLDDLRRAGALCPGSWKKRSPPWKAGGRPGPQLLELSLRRPGRWDDPANASRPSWNNPS